MNLTKKIFFWLVLFLNLYLISFGAEAVLNTWISWAGEWVSNVKCLTIYGDNTGGAKGTNWSIICSANGSTLTAKEYIATYQFNWWLVNSKNYTIWNWYGTCYNQGITFFELWGGKGIVSIHCSGNQGNYYDTRAYDKWVLTNNLRFSSIIWSRWNYTNDKLCFGVQQATYYCYDNNLNLNTYQLAENTLWFTNYLDFTLYGVSQNNYYFLSYNLDDRRFLKAGVNTNNTAFNRYYKLWWQLVSDAIDCTNTTWNWTCGTWYNYFKYKATSNQSGYYNFWPNKVYTFTMSWYVEVLDKAGATIEYRDDNNNMYFSTGAINSALVNWHIEKFMFNYWWQYGVTYYKNWSTAIYWDLNESYVFAGSDTFVPPDTQNGWGGGWGGTGTGWIDTWWLTGSWIVNLTFNFWSWKIINNENECVPFTWLTFNYIQSPWSLLFSINPNYKIISDWSFTILTVDLWRWLSDTINAILWGILYYIFTFLNVIFDLSINPIMQGFITFEKWQKYCFLWNLVQVPNKVNSTFTGYNMSWKTNFDYLIYLLVAFMIIYFIFRKK